MTRRIRVGQRPGEHAAETLPDEAGALPVPIRDLLQQRFDRGQRCRRRAEIDPCAPARGWVAEAL